jgi:hypothetical protein
VRMQIEDNEIDLDPGEYGSLINDITLEVRADDAGKIRVGPMGLNVVLENPNQMVEVTLQAIDENGSDIKKFPPQKFIWNFKDQDTPRFWSVYSSDNGISSHYKYQVRVIVKGGIFTKGTEWTGPWLSTIGNGPLTVSVPTTEDPGVVVKSLFAYKPATSATGKVQPPPAKGMGKTSKEIGYSYTGKAAVNPPPSSKVPLSKKMVSSPRTALSDEWSEAL